MVGIQFRGYISSVYLGSYPVTNVPYFIYIWYNFIIG
jgi:hypothetical protein